jgi:hypothetical protein
MVGAVVWKEYREQRAAWLGLTGLGCGLLALLARWLQTSGRAGPDSPAQYLVAGGLLLSWCYGVVSGSMLLAGEREDGTLEFLDTLPAWRGRLWRAKGLAALALLLAQAVVVVALLALLGAVTTAGEAAGLLAGLAVAGLVGLGWGLSGSARARTVFGAVVRAAGMQVLTALVLVLLLALAWAASGSVGGRQLGPLGGAFLLVAGALTVAAVVRSAHRFREPDRLRHERVRPDERVPRPAALAWLTARRWGWFTVAVCALGLAGGVGVVFSPMFAWPPLTLLLGVLCGVRAFGGDDGARMLLAEQRVPADGVWASRVLACGGCALAGCVLALTPSVAGYLPGLLGLAPPIEPDTGLLLRLRDSLLLRLFRDGVLSALATPGAFLSLWVLHGLAAGLVCGLLFRRVSTAIIVAVLLGSAGAAVWVPSALGGGLHLWQTLGMPAASLVVSRLLLPGWAAGRVGGLRALGVLAAWAVPAALWTAGGLWYRVEEVPQPPGFVDPAPLLADLAAPAPEETARLTRSALTDLGRRQGSLSRRPFRPLFPPPLEPNPPLSFQQELSLALTLGWPGGKPELGEWLDRLFEGDWPGELARAADGPPGVVVDPRGLSIPLRDPSVVDVLLNAHLATHALAVRALQQHARGDDRGLANNLRVGLALTRNLRHHAPSLVAPDGAMGERALMSAVQRWLDRPGDNRQTLKTVLDIVRDHDARCPDDPADRARADRVVVTNALDSPEGWLVGTGLFTSDPGGPVPGGRARAAALGWLWQAPWERARQERVFGWLLAHQRPAGAERFLTPPWTEFPLLNFGRTDHSFDRTTLALRRLALLRLALRLYQAEKGRPAPSLAALVPGYLAKVPVDPFDREGRPFRYRLSRDEAVTVGGRNAKTGAPEPVERRVPAGRGILWSVGPDGRDDGGRRDRSAVNRPEDPSDWVVVVDPAG